MSINVDANYYLKFPERLNNKEMVQYVHHLFFMPCSDTGYCTPYNKAFSKIDFKAAISFKSE